MQTKGNINFILVGAKATGKTVYLTSLYLNEKSVTARDARTIEYLKPFSEALLSGEYPTATSGTLHELMFNYKDEKFSLSIQIDDVDGYFIETLSKKDKETQAERDTLIENMKFSEGIIFFFPYQKLFHDKAIEEFNYEIDTVVSNLKEMYSDRNLIPIPVIIAVSKWDDSPYYQKENELEETLIYIESNKFLQLAKEKIEVNFKHVKIIPISAIGKNINNLKPYNLKKPIEFFLEETYTNWVTKINELKDDKESLLIFLAKVHFDIKFYYNGKYDKLYKKLEKEYTQKMLEEVSKFKHIKEYELFEKKNNKIIKSLLPKNRKSFLSIKKRLRRIQRIKRFSVFSLASILLVITVFSIFKWSINKLLIKNEDELFAEITTYYNNNNYQDAQEDIEDYLSAYEDTVNLEHKQKVLTYKSHIDKILKKQEREQKVSELLAQAYQIVADKNFNNVDKVDEIFSSMNELNIGTEELKSKLLEAKDRATIKQDYSNFKEALENKSFDEQLEQVEIEWKDTYGEEKKSIVRKILDKSLNIKIKQSLEEVSSISDIDAFNDLVHKINAVQNLKKNTVIKKIGYKASLNHENQTTFNEKWDDYEKYNTIFKNGISLRYIAFGANSDYNEPLGFKCNSEDEIILTIDTKIYHYKNKDSCKERKISWRNSQNFKDGNYRVKVIEEDIVENDEYSNSFFLKKNDLIKLENNEKITKNIGRGYYIEIGK